LCLLSFLIAAPAYILMVLWKLISPPAFYIFCRVVSQVEYPSLVDLRGLLLDLVAQLLGALSRIRYTYIIDFYE
jgi:hypothetical protein